MCKLCGNEKERKEEINRLRFIQVELAKLSHHIDAICKGDIKPHTDKMRDVILTERVIVRNLIDDVL